MSWLEGLIFIASSVLSTNTLPLSWINLAMQSFVVALCVVLRRSALIFPSLVMVCLTRRVGDVANGAPAFICALILVMHEAWGRGGAWILALVASLLLLLLFPEVVWWWYIPLAYMLAMEHFTWWPPFLHALDVAERHVCSCLLTALICHVGVWPSDDFSLPSFLVLGLIALGFFLGTHGGKWRWLPFVGIAAVFAGASFVCARLMAGHWMFAWAVQRVLLYREVAVWVAVVLASGLAAIIWLVQDRKDALGFADRKLFHALIVVVFAQAMLRNPATLWIPALTLASFAAFCLLYLVELVRAFSDMGTTINAWYGRWIDDRDSKALVATTHIQLLLGCAVPIWISGGSVAAAVCGVATIGVGDSMAAVVGSRWGSHRWSATNSRTIEGTVAMALSTTAAFIMLAQGQMSVWTSVRVSICVALMEAHTHSRDNLLLPLFAVSLL